MTLEEARRLVEQEERRKARQSAASKKVRCECCGKHVSPHNINIRLEGEVKHGVKVCDECNNYYDDETLRKYTYSITEYPVAWTTGSKNLVPNAASQADVRSTYGMSGEQRKEYSRLYREQQKKLVAAAKAIMEN